MLMVLPLVLIDIPLAPTKLDEFGALKTMVFEVCDSVIFDPAIRPIEAALLLNVAPAVPPPDVLLSMETML